MKLTMTVDVTAGRLVARLVGERPPVLTRDRIADLFLDAVWAALEEADPEPPNASTDDEPEQLDRAPAHGAGPTVPGPVDLNDPVAVQREALRRLDAGGNLVDIAQQLGVAAAVLRRWDRDPAPPPRFPRVGLGCRRGSHLRPAPSPRRRPTRTESSGA